MSRSGSSKTEVRTSSSDASTSSTEAPLARSFGPYFT
jgi:hypothetical protein